jgi:hypothetical protein
MHGPTNQEIKEACRGRLDLTDTDDFYHPFDQEYPTERMNDCEKEIDIVFRTRATPMHRLLRRLKGSMAGKCHVNITCNCCPEKNLGAQFSPKGTATGWIGSIRVCANNIQTADILPYLVHEMTHAAQQCQGYDLESCTGLLRAEMEAYHCQGRCNNARECLREAVKSGCKPGLCSGISDSTISELTNWYENNLVNLCSFPSNRFER